MEDKLGIAIVGLGRVGDTHIDAIRLNPDTTRLVAVVDIDESLAKSTAEKSKVKYYTSVEAALGDPDIQAMVVCLPHDLHKRIGIQIMEANRHVLMEKPIATSLADARQLVEKAKEKGVTLMVGQSHRFFFAIQETKLKIKETIGEPFNLIYSSLRPFHRRTPPLWWQDVEKTGGLAFTMLGSHTIDFSLWFYEGRRPVRVYSEARSLNPKLTGMDEIVIVITFDDGSTATNHLSLNTSPSKKDCLIAGPQGSVFFSHSDSASGLVGVFTCDFYLNGELVQSGEQQPHNFALQMKEFSTAILEKREPSVRNSDILNQLAVIEAARKSAEIHQPVDIDGK